MSELELFIIRESSSLSSSRRRRRRRERERERKRKSVLQKYTTKAKETTHMYCCELLRNGHRVQQKKNNNKCKNVCKSARCKKKKKTNESAKCPML